jgi:hypothetical protein
VKGGFAESSARDRPLVAHPSIGAQLSWLAGILWGHLPGLRIAPRGATPSGHRRIGRYTVLPNLSSPRLLVPVDSPGVASAALRQFNDSMSQRARASKALVGTMLGTGLVGPLARHRLELWIPDGELNGSTTLDAHLRVILGRPDLDVAITLGTSMRPNRKPVLQAISQHGEVLAYAKVGWNDLTRRLVANEAEVLRGLNQASPRHLAAPRLIHHGHWNDLGLTLVSPFPQRIWRQARRNGAPPIAAVQEVATMGPASNERFGASHYRATLWERLAQTPLAPAVRSAVDVALSSLGRYRDREIALGGWHGDWAPWNMSRAGGRLMVWDWERAGHDVPVGLDSIHFHFQVNFQFAGKRVDSAIAAARALAEPELQKLGVAADLDLLVCLYLMEILLRFEEGRVSGILEQSTMSLDLANALAAAAVR